MDITLKLDPTPEEIDGVLLKLVRSNWQVAQTQQGFQPFILSLVDPVSGDSVGGLVGMAEWDWLQVQYVFVPEHLRGQGHGRALMAQAEAFARQRSLLGLWLDSFGFQPQGFFARLGFAPFGTLSDHPVGSARHFLSKRLDSSKA